MIDSSQSSSTRPYLLRALYEWCVDNSLTPYIAAYVDDSVKVPRDHVKNNEIVLNVSMDATSNLQIGNESLQFKARFGGMAREIVVPISHIIAIYARENGQGMAFPVPQAMPPRGEVQESPPQPKRSKGLHSVIQTPSVGLAAAIPQQANPSLASSSSPTKVVKLKSTPKPSKSSEVEAPTEPTPPMAPQKAWTRPSLTRIK